MEENGSFGRGPIAKWLGKINDMPADGDFEFKLIPDGPAVFLRLHDRS